MIVVFAVVLTSVYAFDAVEMVNDDAVKLENGDAFDVLVLESGDVFYVTVMESVDAAELASGDAFDVSVLENDDGIDEQLENFGLNHVAHVSAMIIHSVYRCHFRVFPVNFVDAFHDFFQSIVDFPLLDVVNPSFDVKFHLLATLVPLLLLNSSFYYLI